LRPGQKSKMDNQTKSPFTFIVLERIPSSEHHSSFNYEIRNNKRNFPIQKYSYCHYTDYRTHKTYWNCVLKVIDDKGTVFSAETSVNHRKKRFAANEVSEVVYQNWLLLQDHGTDKLDIQQHGNLPKEDNYEIETIMDQAKVSEEQARESLKKNGNVVDAILSFY
jgi:NACalpha-BTF3-like transcription factor